MRNVMNHQNFTHYPYVMELIKEAEVLFENIQKMEKYAFISIFAVFIFLHKHHNRAFLTFICSHCPTTV